MDMTNLETKLDMTSFEKMLDMITEACEIALGEEWHNMNDKQKHDTVMSFIYTAAQKAQ